MSESHVSPLWSVPAKLMPDARLSRLAAGGDARAFEAIFERHHQELYRYCRAILADADDAQDALQNTMIAAMRSLPGGNAHGRAAAVALPRRAQRGHLDRPGRRREAPLADDSDAVGPGADVAAQDRERLRHLVADIAALPERQRAAIVMRELSDLSYADIGAALATSEAAARQTVYEAREAMREAKGARATDCSEIRELISRRDGRILRGRRLRAHLRHCEGCTDYLAAISRRREDLQLIAPPLPALAASGLMAAIVGGSGKAGLVAGAGSATGAGGGTLAGVGAAGGASAVAKAGAIVAALAVGAGAGVTAAVDLRDGGLNDPEPVVSPAPPAASAEAAQAGASQGRADGAANGAEAGSAPADNRDGHGNGQANGHQSDKPQGNANGGSQPGGSQGQGVPAGGSDGVTGPPAQAQGNGPPASAGTGTGNAGGNSAGSSGVSAAPPRSESGTEHSNAGNSGPPEHANGQGNPHD